jgi:hypothetical protein
MKIEKCTITGILWDLCSCDECKEFQQALKMVSRAREERKAHRIERHNRRWLSVSIRRIMSTNAKYMNVLLIFLLLSCKKDAPPVTNKYQMEIEITDGDPFGNVSAVFAMGNRNYLQDHLIGIDTGQDYVYGNNHPVYVQRSIEYEAHDTAEAFIWIGSTAVQDNYYRVQVFRNDLLIYKTVGYILDVNIQIN